MKKSDAEFFFVVSQVTFMIPHVGGTPTAGATERNAGAAPTHDEAWPGFANEREELIRFWDSLGKPVMVLTGDIHNSFSIKITDRIWEFASGPHNSRNHRADAEANRPAERDVRLCRPEGRDPLVELLPARRPGGTRAAADLHRRAGQQRVREPARRQDTRAGSRFRIPRSWCSSSTDSRATSCTRSRFW